jgi:hypothetical protein
MFFIKPTAVLRYVAAFLEDSALYRYVDGNKVASVQLRFKYVESFYSDQPIFTYKRPVCNFQMASFTPVQITAVV